MEGLWEYLNRITNISSYCITYSGDIPNMLNRWIVKSELADGTWPIKTEPCLRDTKARIILDHEKTSLTEDELKSNWSYYISDSRSTVYQYITTDKFFLDNKDRYVHSLCSVYCEKERDILIILDSSSPLKMWINGRLTYTSHLDYHIKPSLFIYRFKQGFNTILMEKELSQRYKSLNIQPDENIIILKPCDYLLSGNTSKVFGKELLEDLESTYTIVPNRMIYQSGQKISITILQRSIKDINDDSIKVTVTTAGNIKISSIVTETNRRFSLSVNPSTKGILHIKAESLIDSEKFSDAYVFYGDFNQTVENWIKTAERRTDCNAELLSAIKELLKIPQIEKSMLNGTSTLINDRICFPLMEKLFEFQQYILSNDGFEKKDMLDIFRTNAFMFRKSEVDEEFKCYSIYLPKEYNPLKKYPLAIYMQFGYSMSKYPYVQRYVQSHNFKDAIVLNICGRGGINRDYINESEIISIINEVVESQNVDRDRIYIFGTCTGGLAAFGLALRIPHLFTAITCISGTVRLDINEPDYDYLKNCDNTMVFQLGGIEDPAYNCSRCDTTFKHFKNARGYLFSHFSHADVDEMLNQEKLLSLVLKEKKDKYPKEVRYITNEPIYNKSYWLEIEYIKNFSYKAVVDAKIKSEDLIDINTENIGCLNILVSTKHMGLSDNFVLCINKIRTPISVNKYARISVNISATEQEITVTDINLKDFDMEYNRIGLNEKALGIKEVYFRKCVIIKPDSHDRCESVFVKTLCRTLRQPLKERIRNYSYDIFSEEAVDSEVLGKSNFVSVIDVRNSSEMQQRLLQHGSLLLSTDGICYCDKKHQGDGFAVVKCCNPYNPEKKVLIVAINSDTVEEELLNFMTSFDSNPLFYSNAVIYSEGTYHSFVNI